MKKFSGMKTALQKGTREHSESCNGKSQAESKEQLIQFLKNSKRLQIWHLPTHARTDHTTSEKEQTSNT